MEHEEARGREHGGMEQTGRPAAAVGARLAPDDMAEGHVDGVGRADAQRPGAAWLTAPFHWAIFAFGAWAFWTCRPWALRVGAIYAFYVALSHVVWSEASPHGSGWPTGLLHAAMLSIPGFLMLYWQPSFAAALARRAAPER